MTAADCAIVSERLGDDGYRASCPLFPDCEAVASTEAAARQAVAEAIERILRERQKTTFMNPIDILFQRLRSQGRKAFIPFVTAGDPDLSATAQLVEELAHRGASLIEIGFPYSDPIADGPVIQASYTRALARGVRLDNIFACIRELAGSLPIAEQK